MTKVIMAISAIAATLAVATTATAASQARDPRVPALQKKVAQLQRDVAFTYATEQCDDTWNLALNILTFDYAAAGFGDPPLNISWPTSNGMCAATGRSDPTPPSARALMGSHTIFDMLFKVDLQAALAK